MIINFSVENFGSIKDKQTLSFEATKTTHLENYYVINLPGNIRLLKLALIYGANASGKTTILKALDFLRDLVLNPAGRKNDELNFSPFLFDPETPKKTTTLSIEFFANETRYLYEVDFIKSAIVSENLSFYSPNKALVFKRSTDLVNQFTSIKFGSKIKQDDTYKKTLESNTLWNNTVLGGFLKTNIELKELKDVSDWFTSYLNSIIYTSTELDRRITRLIYDSAISKKDVISILKKADFNISNILIKKEDFSTDFYDNIKTFVKDAMSQFGELKFNFAYSDLNLELEHTVYNKTYSLPFNIESHGTKRFYGFAGLLCLLIKKSGAFSIDELECSLHPDLYQHFLLSFLLNSKKSQVIATTHYREILDNKDIFRNDAIWFTDKSENCATELYSLADFDSSVIRDTSNILNAYKSGRLRGTPNLGDYYIDLDK